MVTSGKGKTDFSCAAAVIAQIPLSMEMAARVLIKDLFCIAPKVCGWAGQWQPGATKLCAIHEDERLN
jgi:hypothetical protein